MLKARVLTALALLACFLLALFMLPSIGWAVLIAAVGAVGADEWARLGQWKHAQRLAFVAVVFCLSAFLGAVVPDSSHHGWPWLVFGGGALFWLGVVPGVLKRGKAPLEGGTGALVGLIVLVPTVAAIDLLRAVSPWLLLAGMGGVWLADIAAFFVGRAWGRTKLAPSISPGKSREGAYGAVGAVVVFYVLCAALTGHSEPVFLVITGFVAVGYTILSILGDLFESLAKRTAGVKDSGSLLPGHGGVLDRIDSLTAALPFAALITMVMMDR